MPGTLKPAALAVIAVLQTDAGRKHSAAWILGRLPPHIVTGLLMRGEAPNRAGFLGLLALLRDMQALGLVVRVKSSRFSTSSSWELLVHGPTPDRERWFTPAP
jgi:hypothetical protein